MIYRARSSKAVSAWIADKRGVFTHAGETVCPGFHLYRGFVGCPAWAAGKPCTYCFLKATFRHDPELLKGVAWGGELPDCAGCEHVVVVGTSDPDRCDLQCSSPLDVTPARAAVTTWLAQARNCKTCSNPGAGRTHSLKEAVTCDRYQPMVLNAGELGDSLGFTPEENPHVGMFLDLFSDPATNPHGHKLLLVTKAGLEQTRAHLDERQASSNVILSWSIGNLYGAPWEPYWETASEREEAAAWAARQGWRVRVRLDPLGAGGPEIGNDPNTPRVHGINVALALGGLAEVMTLGTFRHRGGRVKLPAEERVIIDGSAIEGLRDGGYEGPIAVCKETPAVIRELLGIEPGEMRCNCMA